MKVSNPKNVPKKLKKSNFRPFDKQSNKKIKNKKNLGH
jgi:hypothetical protein